MLYGISSLSYRARWSFPFIILCNPHAATTDDVSTHAEPSLSLPVFCCFVLWLFVLLLFDVGIFVSLAFVSHVLGNLVFSELGAALSYLLNTETRS